MKGGTAVLEGSVSGTLKQGRLEIQSELQSRIKLNLEYLI